MSLIIAIVGGAVLFALVGWLGLRKTPCSLEQGGAGCSGSGRCNACPNAGAPEGSHGHV